MTETEHPTFRPRDCKGISLQDLAGLALHRFPLPISRLAVSLEHGSKPFYDERGDRIKGSTAGAISPKGFIATWMSIRYDRETGDFRIRRSHYLDNQMLLDAGILRPEHVTVDAADRAGNPLYGRDLKEIVEAGYIPTRIDCRWNSSPGSHIRFSVLFNNDERKLEMLPGNLPKALRNDVDGYIAAVTQTAQGGWPLEWPHPRKAYDIKPILRKFVGR